MTQHPDPLHELPELEVPPALDALVLERACAALDEHETRAPIALPRPEVLIYAAGLTAYGAYLFRGVQGAVQYVVRVIAG